MSNEYFKFKQFTVQQRACSMKVCTDSCVLGAFAGSEINRQHLIPRNILDIGGGTGLLSLMVAQRSNALLDSVEIQEKCFIQMKENFSNSPWSERLNAIHSDILHWNSGKKYDLILSNPPFFENDLKGEDTGKSIAMHDSGLLLNELLLCIRQLISDGGSFIVMIPASRQEYFEKEISKNEATITSLLALKHREGKPAFRIIYSGNFIMKATKIIRVELTIENKNGYTDDFKNLLKDYYLNL